ncbi:MAG: hypothetical protein K5837_04050 [Candidatus Saccharibacteria bacterium]|jgi:hypothetical protein|nr:hypothetical protein [Candidatus Saccharibacteria bacterium]
MRFILDKFEEDPTEIFSLATMASLVVGAVGLVLWGIALIFGQMLPLALDLATWLKFVFVFGVAAMLCSIVTGIASLIANTFFDAPCEVHYIILGIDIIATIATIIVYYSL